MIFVIMTIFILIIGLCFLAYVLWDLEIISGIVGTFAAIGLGISCLVAISIGVDVSELKVIDDKIIMYEEENQQIEQQISEAIETYQQHETQIYTEVAPESSIILVAAYPELKSDTLVQEQIKVYLKNNEEIKNLKAKKINGDVSRWWLYFGGKSK